MAADTFTTQSQVSFLELLRERTKNAHVELEALPVSKSIINDDVSISSYIFYLNLMLDMWKSAEHTLFPILENHIPDLDSRRKSDTIIADLAKMKSPAFDKHCTLFDGNRNDSVSYVMGMFYVLEGSILGGRYIYQHINSKLGLDETNGAGYFLGYANQTGKKWKIVLDIMTDYQTENSSADEMIAGAEDAFTLICGYFAASCLNS